MKHYPKIHKDLFSNGNLYARKVSSTMGSIDDLISRFRSFYKEAHKNIFDYIVKQIWLEQQAVVDGKRRTKHRGNGIRGDLCFAKLTKYYVGINHRVLTAGAVFNPVSTYLIDFFPEFLMHDPFTEPEKYQYPYEHVTLDFLMFVVQMDERLELLDEAEKRKMLYADFANWATNWALSYNLDHDTEKYKVGYGDENIIFIRNNKIKRSIFWETNKFLFKTK